MAKIKNKTMPKFEKSTGYQMKGSKFYGKGNSSPLKQDKKKDKEIAGEIFGQELQLNKDGKTYNAQGQGYEVAGVTDIIADPKGVLDKFRDKDTGLISDRDFTFETKGDTTHITGVKP